MTSKPSMREVKRAVFDERQKLKGAADVLDDRTEVEDLPLAAASHRVQSWEQRYDALGR